MWGKVKFMCKSITVVAICVWVVMSVGAYFFIFNNGFSNNAADWGSFGSYMSGVITVPFSMISAYFLYKTYRCTETTYKKSITDGQIELAHSAIKEAACFLESALETKFQVDDNFFSFKDIHYNPMLAREYLPAVRGHDVFNAHYRANVGKAFICLYDFLSDAENKYGMTEFIRFYKIKYQWVIRIHNEFDANAIEVPENKTSKDIEDYFYSDKAITKS